MLQNGGEERGEERGDSLAFLIDFLFNINNKELYWSSKGGTGVALGGWGEGLEENLWFRL